MSILSNLSDDFNKTLIDSNLSDIGVEQIENTLDSFLDEGIIKDIPIIRTIAGLLKTTSNISNFLLLKKILSFLNGIKEINPQKRKDIIEKIDNSQKYRIKVGEKLLYIIDQCDDYEKAEYIAHLFVAFLSEQINYEEFQKGAVAINTLNLMDFKRFLSYDKGSHISLEECTEFIGVGLMFLYTEEILLIKNDDREIYEDYILRGGDMKTEFTDFGEKINLIFSSLLK